MSAARSPRGARHHSADTRDVHVVDLGSIWRFQVSKPTARAWVEEYVHIPEPFGSSVDFVADHRAARVLLEGLVAAGFTVST